MKVKKLSRAAELMLMNALHGYDLYSGLSGRSQHGGAAKTRVALERRGLIDVCGEPTQLARDNYPELTP